MADESRRWQPMATAPDDGTRILATVRASEQGAASVDTIYWNAGDGLWRASDSHPNCVISYHPREIVAWMPLPAPGSLDEPMPVFPEPAAEKAGSGI